ncbi:MAG: NAD-glutamate dehydrogenase [Gammaproteobacteria bacterium]|nr:NAD-glutamate dehydrogenase [Gammaproteobacteria bacterium]
MQRRISDARKRLLDNIVEHAEGRGGKLDIAGFIRHYFRNVSVEDLRQRSPEDLAGAALGHLAFARERTPGEPKLRIFNPEKKEHGWTSTHTVVEMVNDDMPFLVDSMSMVLQRQGLSNHLTVHPVITVQRTAGGRLRKILDGAAPTEGATPESLVHVEVDRETDLQRLEELERRLLSTLADVRAAYTDWQAMRQKALEVCESLHKDPSPVDANDVSEGAALLEWMANDNFTFLGYRDYKLVRDGEEMHLDEVPGTGLGILRRKNGGKKDRTSNVPSRYIRRQARSRDLLIITKANSLATVHRPGYLDYVGVKTFDDAGRVSGERRFLGLFTSVAYSRSPRDIPLLRHKVRQVMERSGLPPRSHGGKALMHILDTFPRDELFHSSVEDLVRTTSGIFNLQERQRVSLFIRRDDFRRFVSCLVFVPRDKYNTQVRRRIEAILKEACDGESLESSVQLSESNLARVHIIVRTTPGQGLKIRAREIEKHIAEAVRTWADILRETLIERFDEERGLALFRAYAQSFPAAYVEDVTPRAATFDIERLVDIAADPQTLRMSLYRPPTFPEAHLRFKLFRPDEPIPISDVLPMLENMGLKVISERPYRLQIGDDSEVWIQDFEMSYTGGEALDPASVRDIFQDAFARVWYSDVENDGFNRLVLAAHLSWRETAMLRACCRYLLQTGLPFSQQYMERVLYNNAHVSSLLIRLFDVRCNPDHDAAFRLREKETCERRIKEALDGVASLDEDRILRAFLAVIQATLRTNYYQRGDQGQDENSEAKPYMSFKYDPAGIPDLPLPRPMFEVFVYSPRVEGVHLRGAKVARGGLRWSDRPEDFRTEVLGLMKAQNVKNTVIVPMGAKGGFVAKRLPAGDRELVQREVVYCYRTFIRGLLDITDNIVDGVVVPPRCVLRHDGDDPYLVVAADKGTATFSDLANEISKSYGFWLGDAFASGGSVGYDHKKMGITARGAWEAVKRHFREMGVDIQTEDFTVIGIGDMAGDVFGNGMLQSRHLRLKAAFNHMHIFLDPDPDAEQSYAERERLFNLPRSTWDDYSPELISKGGGVFSRREKSIVLNPQARKMLGVGEAPVTPQALIRAVLKMPVDLFWNGGIGTYVKASHEANASVGDRANDNLRVNASELKAKVVGEGGNLGFTQLGRVEYALNGGRINTDFIDNSAGVDCSDREVNIKILLNQMAESKPLTPSRRRRLLEAMTEEVAQLVLRNNYLQSQAISMTEAHAAERINEHGHLVRSLQRSGVLDRALEFLPSDEDIVERRKLDKGFTRPEIAIIVSYSKIALYSRLIDSNVPEDSYLAHELHSYFPAPLRRRYKTLMNEHRLSREIVATLVTNSMINRMGPVFPVRAAEETGADSAAIARAYTISREVFDVRALWAAIEGLDNQVHANTQYSMMFQTTRLLRQAAYWFLNHYKHTELDIEAAVSRLRPGVSTLLEDLPDLLLGPALKRFQEHARTYIDLGVPEKAARRMAALQGMYAALDIVEAAQELEADVKYVAAVYYELGRGLSLDWVRERIEALEVEGHWQAVARGALRENLYSLQRTLAAKVIAGRRSPSPAEAVVGWLGTVSEQVTHAKRTLKEMRTAGARDFPTLSVALQEIRKLTV